MCGLVTEVGEIVDGFKRHWFYKKPIEDILKNLKEEIGDVMWSISLAYYALDEPIPADIDSEIVELTAPGLDMILAKLVRYSSNMFATCFAYPYDSMKSNMDYDLRQLLTYLAFLARSYETSLLKEGFNNYMKLKKRYPDGFSSFRALNRNTENELSHIH